MKYFLGIVLILSSNLSANAAMVQHAVQPGETLQTISWKYFGTTRKWYKIFKENNKTLETPDSLEPGMTLHFEGPAAQTEAKVEVPKVQTQQKVTPPAAVEVKAPAAVAVPPAEDLRTLSTQANKALESARQIQSQLKAPPQPQRAIAATERFSAIEGDSSDVDASAVAGDMRGRNQEQSIPHRRVNFRFGSRQLLGPEF